MPDARIWRGSKIGDADNQSAENWIFCSVFF